MIPLKGWNSYLKNIYKFPNDVENILDIYTKYEAFSKEDIEFGVTWLSKKKS